MKMLKDIFHQKKHVLIVSLPSNDPKLAKASWEAGADAVKVHMNVEHRASKTVYKSFEEEREILLAILNDAQGPCGIVAGSDVETVSAQYKKAIDAGFDFISLYAHHAPLGLLDEKGVAKMLAFDSSYSLTQLQYLHKIGADIFEASVMKPESYGERLSARELITYSEICSSTHLPVVVPSQRNIKPQEVSHLINCGVKATMIGAIVTGKTEEQLKKAVYEFRNEIDKN